MGDEQVMQPARARQARVERGIEHAGGIAQQALRMVQGERLHESLWRQPGPAAEQMVQFIRRHGGSIRHRLDGRLRPPVLRDEGDGAAHRVVIAQRGVVEARLGQALFLYGCHHHGV